MKHAIVSVLSKACTFSRAPTAKPHDRNTWSSNFVRHWQMLATLFVAVHLTGIINQQIAKVKMTFPVKLSVLANSRTTWGLDKRTTVI